MFRSQRFTPKKEPKRMIVASYLRHAARHPARHSEDFLWINRNACLHLPVQAGILLRTIWNG
jgi:hypothetical protein